MSTQRIVFTAEEKRLIGICANAVWNEMAYDIFVAVAQEHNDNLETNKKKRKSINDVTIPRSYVIELVLDADRLHHMLKRRLNDLGEALWEKIQKAQHRTVMNVMKEAFPYINYGT